MLVVNSEVPLYPAAPTTTRVVLLRGRTSWPDWRVMLKARRSRRVRRPVPYELIVGRASFHMHAQRRAPNDDRSSTSALDHDGSVPPALARAWASYAFLLARARQHTQQG